MPPHLRTDGTPVVLSVTIDEQGDVIDAHIVRSHPPFDDSALAAVRKWKFIPARMNGRAICAVVTVTVMIDPA